MPEMPVTIAGIRTYANRMRRLTLGAPFLALLVGLSINQFCIGANRSLLDSIRAVGNRRSPTAARAILLNVALTLHRFQQAARRQLRASARRASA
jgi:hypothetical protein